MPRTAGHRGAGCAWIRRSLSAISSHLLLCSYNRKLMVTDPETHEVYAPQLPALLAMSDAAALPLSCGGAGASPVPV